MTQPEVLDEKIIYQSGCFREVRRWLRGTHPELGQIIRGYTGWETVQEIRTVKPMATFTVVEAEGDK